MKIGDTFRAVRPAAGPDEKRHLWVVLSDPDAYPDEVVVAFISTLRQGFDQTCVLGPGDHPFIDRPSVVAYSLVEVRRRSDLLKLVKLGKIESGEPMALSIVCRMRMALEFSPNTQRRFIEIAKGQQFDRPL